MLWVATNYINKEDMLCMGKEINQEEIWCKVTKKQLNNKYGNNVYLNQKILSSLLNSKNINDYRMIAFTIKN